MRARRDTKQSLRWLLVFIAVLSSILFLLVMLRWIQPLHLSVLRSFAMQVGIILTSHANEHPVSLIASMFASLRQHYTAIHSLIITQQHHAIAYSFGESSHLVGNTYLLVYHVRQNAWLFRFSLNTLLLVYLLNRNVLTVLLSLLLLLAITYLAILIIREQHSEAQSNIVSDKNNIVSPLLRRIPMAMLVLDSSFHLKAANPMALQLLGITEVDILEFSLFVIMKRFKCKAPNIKKAYASLCRGQDLNMIPIKFIPFGAQNRRYASVTILYKHKDTSCDGYWIFLEDTTAFKQWEAYSSRNDRINLIAEFAASTAHEIRNPLTTVRGFLQLQKRRIQDDTAKNHFQIMIDEIDRVDSLITEYLTMAKTSLTATRLTIYLDELLDAMIPLITAEANLRGITVNIGLITVGTVLARPHEIKQVLLNLTKNAIDAMDKGGVLTISSRLEAGFYVISVSDTGFGIPIQNLAHIFDPHFTTKQTGSGMGLYVSHNIVTAHQGTLKIESSNEKGTTFLLSLPLGS